MKCVDKGYEFESETDTEVAAHLIHDYLKQGLDLVEAVGKAVARFEGAYALLVVDAEDPNRIVVSRVASPLVIGLGDGENFVASGVPALLPVTQRFIYLEQGDLAEIRRDGVRIVDTDGNTVDPRSSRNGVGQRLCGKSALRPLHVERDISISQARWRIRSTVVSQING